MDTKLKTTKRTKTENNRVTFTSSDNGDSGVRYFWIDGLLLKDTNELWLNLGINGGDSPVIGRYDQEFTIEEAKDIIKFLKKKISEFEKLQKQV